MSNRDNAGPRGERPKGQRRGTGSRGGGGYPRRSSAPGEGQERGTGSRGGGYPRRSSAPGEGFQRRGTGGYSRHSSPRPDVSSNKQLLERIDACYELLIAMQKQLNQIIDQQ